MANLVLPPVADPRAPAEQTLTPEEQAEFLELKDFYELQANTFGVEQAEKLFRDDPDLGVRMDQLIRKSLGSQPMAARAAGEALRPVVYAEDNPELMQQALGRIRESVGEREAKAASQERAFLEAATGQQQPVRLASNELALQLPKGSEQVLAPAPAPQPVTIVEEPVAVVEANPETEALRRLAQERQQFEEQRRQVEAQRIEREEALAERNRKAALLMMQAAAQPIGPSTIGEAITGKYGQAQAQAAQDINLVRQFFGERGKSSRSLLKERELRGKEDRFRRKETRLRQQARERNATKERIAAQRDKVKQDEGRLNRELREYGINKRYDVAFARWDTYDYAARARATLGRDWHNFKSELQNTSQTRSWLSGQGNEMRRIADTELRRLNMMERKVGQIRQQLADEEGFAASTFTDNSEVIGRLQIDLLNAEAERDYSRGKYNEYIKSAQEFAKTRQEVSQKSPPPSGRTSQKKTKKVKKRRRRRRRISRPR